MTRSNSLSFVDEEGPNVLTSRFDFAGNDGMGHPRITVCSHIRAHLFQDFRRLLDALPRDVRVGIARTKEGRRTSKVARVSQIGTGRTDQPACKRNEACIPARVPRNELSGQTCALREAGDHYILRRNPRGYGELHNGFNSVECRGEVGLVLFQGCEKRIRIPGVVCRLRGQVGKFRPAQSLTQGKDVLCRAAPTVEEDHHPAGLVQGRAQLQERLIAMRIDRQIEPPCAVCNSIGGSDL